MSLSGRPAAAGGSCTVTSPRASRSPRRTWTTPRARSRSAARSTIATGCRATPPTAVLGLEPRLAVRVDARRSQHEGHQVEATDGGPHPTAGEGVRTHDRPGGAVQPLVLVTRLLSPHRRSRRRPGRRGQVLADPVTSIAISYATRPMSASAAQAAPPGRRPARRRSRTGRRPPSRPRSAGPRRPGVPAGALRPGCGSPPPARTGARRRRGQLGGGADQQAVGGEDHRLPGRGTRSTRSSSNQPRSAFCLVVCTTRRPSQSRSIGVAAGPADDGGGDRTVGPSRLVARGGAGRAATPAWPPLAVQASPGGTGLAGPTSAGVPPRASVRRARLAGRGPAEVGDRPPAADPAGQAVAVRKRPAPARGGPERTGRSAAVPAVRRVVADGPRSGGRGWSAGTPTSAGRSAGPAARSAAPR